MELHERALEQRRSNTTVAKLASVKLTPTSSERSVEREAMINRVRARTGRAEIGSTSAARYLDKRTTQPGEVQ
jgi:hypothetical protein